MEKIKQSDFISPFSYNLHDWELKWKIISSNSKYDRPNENRSEKEERALEAIASVGVIGGLQLKNLFHLSKNQLKSMYNRHLLIRHSLYKDGKEIPIYTIGKFGANKIMPEYKENYWLEMDTIKVLKCISFFQFCYLFDDMDIIPSPDPFTAGIKLNKKRFFIYVVKDGIKDLSLFLKWKKNFNESIFILTERLDYVEEMNIYLEAHPLKIRVILDEQLKDRELHMYYYDLETSMWKKG